MKTPLRLLAAALAVLLAACSSTEDAAPSAGPVVPPDSATTGNKWVPEESLGGSCFKLVDEECGGTDEADYFSYFEAPVFRTGHLVGSIAYVVDGTNIWVVDLSAPASPVRLGIVTGVGRALAITGRGDRLYVAAAERGVVEFRIDAQAPAQLERLHEVALNGPALDIALSTDGREAFVAMGAGGLGRVKLDGEAPIKGAHLSLNGHAAGVAVGTGTDGLEYVYVAACSWLSVIDPVQNLAVGSLPLNGLATEAPMPVKDVAVADGLALIAAGRWGLVAVDVSMPRHPMLLGNLTLPEDLLYYANGVTVSHDQVYIAAGDWGVDRKPLADLRRSLSHEPPTLFARYCTAAENPDLTPAPEFQTRLPPPREQDPLDVIPFGDHLLAMGDASRLGVRAVDVYALDAQGAHTLAGRYEEPGLVSSIAAGGGTVAVAGRVSGLFAPDDAKLLQRSAPLEGEPRVVALDRQARLIALDEQGALSVGGQPMPEAGALAPMLGVSGDHLAAVHQEGGVELIGLADAKARLAHRLESAPFNHGATHAFVGDKLFLSSGDWERVGAIDLTSLGQDLAYLDPPLVASTELDNPGLWRLGPPRRVLVGFGDSLVEAVSFGGRASAMLRQVGGGEERNLRFSVPASNFVGGASDAGRRRLWLVQGDRATYRTTVTEVDFSAGFDLAPVQRSQVFLGTAVGAALLDQRLYVADREVGVRVFEVTALGLEYLGTADLQEGQ